MKFFKIYFGPYSKSLPSAFDCIPQIVLNELNRIVHVKLVQRDIVNFQNHISDFDASVQRDHTV